MAYLDHDHTHKRLAGVTGVALVHLVLAAGLTAGLAINYTRPPPPTTTGGEQIPIPPLPDPTDTPEPADNRPVTDHPTAPIPPLPFPTGQPVDPTPQDPSGPQSGPGTGEGPPTPPPTPPPSPQPSTPPRPPVPSTASAGWITTEDYPRVALSREWEGTTGYELEINAQGRVAGCRITSSSGHDLLDDAACARLTRRARFRPATGRDGEVVAGSWRGSVTWQIPE